MASDLSFVQFVVDQLEADLGVTWKRMFGEFGVYSHGKIVALICDNQLFIKPTDAGREFIGEPVEAPAYPGARPSFLIEERLEDAAWLSELVRLTERALPAPKPKKKRRS